MFCRKCGAAVSGNYCCVCGERVRSAAEVFRRDVRRKKSALKTSVGAGIGADCRCIKEHILDSCWYAASNKYELQHAVWEDKVRPYAYERLQKTADLAHRLYLVLMEEVSAES